MRLRTRETVASETPASAASAAPMTRRRRKASMAATVAGEVWLGEKRGREERSRNPSTPRALKRATHLPTVLLVVLKRRGGGDLRQTIIQDRPDHLLSTFRRKAGILMDAHSVLSERPACRDISFSGPNRMDNLLKVHS